MAFFTAAGRLRRRDYFLRVVGLYALGGAMYAVPGLLYAAEVPDSVGTVAGLGFMVIGYLVTVQCLLRLHDLDLRAWWALVLLLPGVSYVLGSGMQLVQGTVGPNRFGPDPKRPHLALPAFAPPTAAGEELIAPL